MKKLIKRAAAAALSLALIGGVMPFEAGTFDLSKISLTAEAASRPYIYDGDIITIVSFDSEDVITTSNSEGEQGPPEGEQIPL